MAFGLSKQKVSPIAVDFGADSLKLLQVVPEHPAQLVAAAAAVVPPDARSDPAARLAFYTTSLRRLLKSQPFRGRRAMLAIPGHQTLMQNIEVATQEGLGVEPQIEAHLRDRLNMDPARMVIRHFEVAAATPGPQREVVVLAAPRDAVIGYLNLARGCKLDVVGMHGVPLAILRAFAHLYQRNDDAGKVVAFLDIGAATTTLLIAHGTDLIFAKTIQAAGDQMTRQYAAAHKVAFAEAREARMAPAAAAAGAGPVAVQTIAAPTANGSHASDVLLDEVQLCMRYYQRRFPDQPVAKLVFVGGESRHTPLCQKIARALRIAAQLGDPFAALMRMGKARAPVGVDLNQPQPGWAVPYGLCWSEANL